MRSDGYDAAVVGAGVFGAWIAHALARSGRRVALVDAHGVAHARASSGGLTRIVRAGYGDQEIYSRWSLRSLTLWLEILERAGRPDLFHRSGVLWMARDTDPLAAATLAVLARLGVPHERLGPEEIGSRWPQFDLERIAWGLFEPQAGFLLASRAVQAVVDEARSMEVDLLHEEIVPPREIPSGGRLREIRARSGRTVAADQIVFACGPWLPGLFPDLLGDRIFPTRQDVFYLGTPPGDARFTPDAMPVWLDLAEEIYGLPDVEGRGFKIALDRHGPPADPELMDRTVAPEAADSVRAYAGRRLPALRGAPLVGAEVCQYENTSNGDFLIDSHPALDNVWLVGGGSGHGFKHGPMIGEHVAERLAGGGSTDERFLLASKQTVQRRTVY